MSNGRSRFKDLNFEGFRQAATDKSLSKYEKIGFPDTYRQGKEEAIFECIRSRLDNLRRREKVVLDIGPGCSDLPLCLIEHCRAKAHQLILVDSAEMLALLPGPPHVQKIAGCFPEQPDCDALFAQRVRRIDVIIVYSVLHYVFAEGNLWKFVDRCLALLADGGELLLGDIPNVSKRRRFFSSAAGIAFHQAFTRSLSLPEVSFNCLEPDSIDDSVVAAIVARARGQGFDAYVLPQPETLPMANRREDILIRKP